MSERLWQAWFGPAGYIGSFDPGKSGDVGRIYTIRDAEKVRAALLAGEPPTPHEPGIAVARAGLRHLKQHPQDLAVFTDFRQFLAHWPYRSQELKAVRTLGEDLWPGQEQFIEALTEHDHVYTLKGRKVGLSTCAIGYAGFVLRCRDPHGRIHLHSRAERAALELLDAVRFGLKNLPEWMRLPVARSTRRELELDAGGDDRRLAVGYATTDAVAVEATATHAMLDEWADMARCDVVYQSLEPTFSAPGCTSLIITTGVGPASPSADYWRRCLRGEGLHFPLFVPANARPDRDDVWLARKKKDMLPSQFKIEYALTWEDAIAGTAEYVFPAQLIEYAHRDALPPGPPKQGHKYVAAFDIGSVQDATVGVVLDVTGAVHDVADLIYCPAPIDYPAIVRAIESTYEKWKPEVVVIERNNTGQAVLDLIRRIPAYQLDGWITSHSSKPPMIALLYAQLQNQQLKWDASFKKIDDEMLQYQDPDVYCQQDVVMALGIAVSSSGKAFEQRVGRILGVWEM